MFRSSRSGIAHSFRLRRPRQKAEIERQPTEGEISKAIDALFKFGSIPPAVVHPHMLVDALVGWLDLSSLPTAEQRMLKLLINTVKSHSRPALFTAIRRYLAPRGTVQCLANVTPGDWAICKELYNAKLFFERKVARSTLEELVRDPKKVPSRADWESAFGRPLPRPTRWRAFGHQGGSLAPIRARVDAAGGKLDGLSVREVLTLALPMPTTGEGYGSPMSWFVQNHVHFAEALTSEGVNALALYLGRRARELAIAYKIPSDAKVPIVEIGAGAGRLSYLLNKTGLLPPPGIIATDPDPTGGDVVPALKKCGFEVTLADDAAALTAFRPFLVLCSWMEFGTDLTPKWRKARVPEYVLIGELGKRPPPPQTGHLARDGLTAVGADGRKHQYTHEEYVRLAGTSCYSLNLELDENEQYERVLLEEVSRELLHIKDCEDAEEGRDGEEREALGAAVAFRYKGAPRAAPRPPPISF